LRPATVEGGLEVGRVGVSNALGEAKHPSLADMGRCDCTDRGASAPPIDRPRLVVHYGQVQRTRKFALRSCASQHWRADFQSAVLK
jgi:hypothetical protein